MLFRVFLERFSATLIAFLVVVPAFFPFHTSMRRIYGTLGRNVFRSLPFYNWDLSVTKAWKFKERLTSQFRVEFFNILNHLNISNPFGGPGGDNSFTDPSGTAGSSFGFGSETPDVTSSNPVLGSGGPRAIQLGLKNNLLS
jgi:hypothetical protein